MLSGTEGAIITLLLSASSSFSGGTVKLENILLVRPDEKETKQDVVTGIEDVTKTHENVNTKVFSLSGQRLAAPRKGINIIGGRKVVIK